MKKKVLCNFDPAAGHEQKGKRPALILSPVDFNKVFGLALAAPISSRVRGHAFETALNDPDIKIKGVDSRFIAMVSSPTLSAKLSVYKKQLTI